MELEPIRSDRIVLGRIRQTAYRPARSLRRDGWPNSGTGGPVHRYDQGSPYPNVYTSLAEGLDEDEDSASYQEPVMPMVRRRLPPPRPGLKPYFTNADGDHYVDVETGAVIQFQLSDKGNKDLDTVNKAVERGLGSIAVGVFGGLVIAAIIAMLVSRD